MKRKDRKDAKVYCHGEYYMGRALCVFAVFAFQKTAY